METSYNNRISNLTQPNLPDLQVKICDTFFSRFRGFMFTASILPSQGLILAYPKASIVDSSIHMFFMNFNLSVFWLNSNLQIIDKINAERWKPIYASHTPAMYVLEAHPVLFDQYEINDRLVINRD